ncbi:tryptophanyl-tRNA synthetase [Saccharata proteae CBS 121410]|uniref:Tryptophan--tRNA ligase, mitochondrial n=1 Tax=Saccharata proteae CBS 121410 TaxID=1314787 RepID=A0A9P4HVU8_9PEZI|nr:tryptophanyl-tRNA synthetase [Saccharata proteae CBS 121410]
MRFKSPHRVLTQATRRYQSTSSRPQVIFSGIQPTGRPHLGNYLGALQQWVKLQNEAAPDTTLIYSIVDLHAITAAPSELNNGDSLRRVRREMLATLLAVGLDPNRSIIFHQSAVPAHTELMWILSCHAPMGHLARMTQWKSKLVDQSNTPSRLGLFTYPVLQAADVLVHGATHVPVGEDQVQHLEFARECAMTFNRIYKREKGERILLPPDTLLSPAKRVMSLTNPTAKMSKSDPKKNSRILLTNDKNTIEWKLRSALTDSISGLSYEPKKRPGVSNLIEILFNLDPAGASSCEELAKDLQNLSMKALKERLLLSIEETFAPIRSRYNELMHPDKVEGLDQVAEEGAAKAAKNAAVTLDRVKEAVGLK